ncbi:acetyl-CoA hydrolase/transferase C-terminal domain-containing protein [Natronobacterium gregoryi]|uniref:Acetyl-CoA hydrolase n=2 Tax=Natronobacterium gregoryi TaxID=44930 RepID=L0AHH4_NATGS|nr:acetyl-CoA hydrolase/transferase C-terminal domain-containing protein [Natronobacterium gregoryi]AFZ73358.1 acetyl-CoA hydrolase [Natronobacterium gregoryi SP2]ELY68555.1 succinate CoA transferase [Natronobacterium gregoryi SP2]PLK19640.1 acetyl-CoA hydrolase [Natronobacterium gregoryi SP2]SFI74100.1 succinyl-CoA:acetate CoA-transferase [Natronobacterium gregoryi]
MSTPTLTDDLPPRIDHEASLPVVDADAAAATIDDDATVAVSGFGSVGDPKAVPLALARAADAGDRDPGLTIVSGGSVGDPLDTTLVEAGGVDRRYPFVATDAARTAVNDRSIAFADRSIAGMSDDIRLGRVADPDVALVEAVAVGSDWLIPSTSVGQTPAYVRAADEVIVEVNDAQPRALAQFHDVVVRDVPPNRTPIDLASPGDRIGDAAVSFDPSKLRAVVRTDDRDDPYVFREPTDADQAIADNLISLLETEYETDPVFGAAPTLQFGVGSLGNALMSALSDSTLADSDTGLRYFGEVIQDGLLDLLEDGVLEAASATSLALSAEGQDRLFESPSAFAEDIVLRPSDISNAPSLIDRFGVVAVNSAIEVDLYGHVNATHIGGSRLVSGVGGSVDFNPNAHLTVIATPATAAGGEISTIVPEVTHVDVTEHAVDAVVTEHGVADLRGTSPLERAAALVECATPEFRPALQEYVEQARERGGHVPRAPERAVNWPE